jgi:nucleotide-binding universal stress UspA family protein
MFQRIIVPLDGSRRAERAIPVAANLARVSQGSIVFLRVVVPQHEIGSYGAEPAVGVVPSMLEIRIAEADHYLSSVATIFRDYLTGIKIETEVETGRTASTLVSAAGFEHGDLIVLCSHGDTGLKRWVFKSVAVQAMRHSPIPVLVLNEHSSTHSLEDLVQPFRVLVPLDGSVLAETVLDPLVQLMAALSPNGMGTLHMLSVIDLPVLNGSMRGQIRVDPLVSEHMCAEAERYLDVVIKRLQEEIRGNAHLSITKSIIVSSDVPGTIMQQAEEKQCDMIAMATHGRGGLIRILMGSVTERVLGHTLLPLLVARPHKPIVEHKDAPHPVDNEQEIPSWVGLL